MLPPLTDLVALMGIAVVLCTGCLRLLDSMRWGSGVAGVTRSTRSAKWVAAICFVVLWCPVGSAQLPLVAYIRGISSDLSITLVALACLNLRQRLLGLGAVDLRERMAVNAVVGVAALLLYPLALGWGDWDAYRVGWGAPRHVGRAAGTVTVLLGPRSAAGADSCGIGLAGMAFRPTGIH